MLDPEQPHFIPSSPISVFSDDDQTSELPEAAWDSVPIFANEQADAETVPADPTVCLLDRGGCEAPAAADPSVCLLDRTGSSAGDESYFDTEHALGPDRTGSSARDESYFDTEYLREVILRLDHTEFLEYVIANSWTSVVVGALNPLQTSK